MEELEQRPVAPKTRLEAIELRVTRWLVTGAGFVLFFLVLLITTDVAGRYIFNKPVQGTLEISANVFAIAVFGSLAYYQVFKGHISLDLVTSHMGKRTRFWSEIFSDTVATLVCAGLTWQTFLYFLRAWEMSEVTNGVVAVPLWPPKLAVFIGLLLLFMVFAVGLFTRIMKAIRRSA